MTAWGRIRIPASIPGRVESSQWTARPARQVRYAQPAVPAELLHRHLRGERWPCRVVRGSKRQGNG